MSDELDDDLTALVRLIEQKMNWGEGEEWSGQEFETLSENILNATGQTLSVTTLKRIWGRAKQKNSPSRSTLNILAQFAGFDNWNHFRKETKAPVVRTITSQTAGRRKWKATWLLLLPVLFLILWSYWPEAKLSEQEIAQIVFTTEMSADSFPRTVTFHYDVGELAADDFEIFPATDQDRTIPVINNRGTTAATYYYPGYYRVQLLYRGVPVREKIVKLATATASTSGHWQALMNRSSLNFPIYLPEEQLRQDSLLGLQAAHFETLGNSQDYINIRLINLRDSALIDGNQFSFSSVFRLETPFPNSPCKVISVIIHGTAGDIAFGFAIPGCTGDLNFDLAGEAISGSTIDLSPFGLDPTQWLDLKVLNKGGMLQISANDTTILEYPHQKDLGRLGGVSLVFDGLGVVQEAELADLTQRWQLF